MAATKKTYSTDWKPRKATNNAIEKFEEMFAKEMGSGVLSRSDRVVEYEVIPTGSIAFDVATGIGGIPRGRVIEIWGPEHSGKTTRCMELVREAQHKWPDKMAAWVDMEQTFDKAYATKLGVDLKRLWLVENPKTAEDVADATKRFVESGLCSVVVLDSVGGMISKAEFEKESDEAVVANVARIVTRMVKQVSPMGNQNGTTTVVVNQVRANIGKYGGDQTTGGGWALKHVTSMKIKVSRGGSLPLSIKVDGADLPVGFEVSLKIEKNKCAPFGRVANLWFFNQATEKYGPIGVDQASEAIDFGVRYHMIEGAGTAWLTYEGERFNGKDKMIAWVREHPEHIQAIRNRVLDALSGQVLDDDQVSDAEAGASEDPMEAMLDTSAARPVAS